MYMRTFLILIFSFLVTLELSAQQDNVDSSDLLIIDTFIKELGDEETPLDVILSQYIEMSSKIDDDMIDYLIASLQEIRLNLQIKDIEKLEILTYDQLPAKERKYIDLADKQTDSMYFIHYNKKNVFSLYLQNGKIFSFTLVSNEHNKVHFVTY